MAASGGAFSAALKAVTRPEHLRAKTSTDTLQVSSKKSRRCSQQTGRLLHLDREGAEREGGKIYFLRIILCHILRFIAVTPKSSRAIVDV